VGYYLANTSKVTVIAEDNKEKIQVVDSTQEPHLILTRKTTQSVDGLTPHALEHYVWRRFSSELKLLRQLEDSRPFAILSPQEFKGEIPDGCIAVCGQDFFDFVAPFASKHRFSLSVSQQ
jgi:hypothetical protein